LPTKKKFKVQLPAEKIMCFIFLVQERGFSCGFTETGTQDNSAHYLETLKKMEIQTASITPEKKGKFLLLHSNAKPHTCILTRRTTVVFGWTVLLHHCTVPALRHQSFTCLAR
jgi:hypothetical protein